HCSLTLTCGVALFLICAHRPLLAISRRYHSLARTRFDSCALGRPRLWHRVTFSLMRGLSTSTSLATAMSRFPWRGHSISRLADHPKYIITGITMLEPNTQYAR
ncbi:hypothetical protein FRC08_015480, partial [Ceratobasidium sp. 394]